MEKINIYELNEISKKKDMNKLKLYNKLIRSCHNRIKSNAINNYKTCMYTIPSYTFGYPLYNINELVVNLRAQTCVGGFTGGSPVCAGERL